MMSKLIDLTGQIFGRLKVIRRTDNDKWGHSRWLCLCDCKNKMIILGDLLKRGHTKSCGCLRKESTIRRFTKHGHKRSGETTGIYRSWQDMKNRCTNSSNKQWNYYGGRGITVCKRWMKFSNFLKDMGETWKSKLTIERKDNNKGYSPRNCYWATWKQQQRNRRSNRPLTHNGKTQLLVEWSEETGISSSTIRARIRLGWSIKKALETLIKNNE